MSEGKLLVFVGYTPYDDQIDYNKPESFLPVMDKGNGFELIPDCNIICNKDDIFPAYMIALEFDEKDLTLQKSFALYGSGGEPYVSRDKIFFHGNGEMSGRTITHTRIYCVDYTGESFKLLGSVKLAGHTIKNKWSMDEYLDSVGDTTYFGVIPVPKMEEDMINRGTVTFMMVNPNSENLEDTLQYISDFAKAMLKEKDSFIDLITKKL